MVDVDAQRNARRRRILENSEKRLSKITEWNSDRNVSKDRYIPPDLNIQTFLSEEIEKEIADSSSNGKVSGLNNIPSQVEQPTLLLFTNRINYILLAIIVNMLLVLQLDRFFGKILALLYLPILLSRLYNYKRISGAQQNNLLYAALILCNIRPQLTYRFKQLVTLLHMILGDLALYIFSFTIIHYVFFLLST